MGRGLFPRGVGRPATVVVGQFLRVRVGLVDADPRLDQDRGGFTDRDDVGGTGRRLLRRSPMAMWEVKERVTGGRPA